MENNVILSVRDLDVKFTLRGQTLHAVRGASLDVYEGESLAIVGESRLGARACSSRPSWGFWTPMDLSPAGRSSITGRT